MVFHSIAVAFLAGWGRGWVGMVDFKQLGNIFRWLSSRALPQNFTCRLLCTGKDGQGAETHVLQARGKEA